MNVSILICTYGDEEWPRLAHSRAWPSCAGQGALEVLMEYQPHGTIASSRNAAAERAKGDYLLYLDADDELAPGYLLAMSAALLREHEYARGDFLLTPSVQKVVKGKRQRPAFYPEVDLLQANWLIIGTLISRDLFMRAGGFPDYPHGFEDWGLWYKAARLGAKVVRVPKAVYVQHVNLQSKHRQGWRNRRWQVETHQRVQGELEAWTPTPPPPPEKPLPPDYEVSGGGIFLA